MTIRPSIDLIIIRQPSGNDQIRPPGDLKEQKKRVLGRVVSSFCKIFLIF